MMYKWRVPLSMGMLVIGILVLVGCGGGRTFQVIFDEAEGLSVGDPVVYKGIIVGEVTGMDFLGSRVAVTVRIDGQYADLMRTSAVFCLEDPKLVSVLDQKQLRVEILDPDSPPIENDQVFEGATARTSCWLQEKTGFLQQQLRLGELEIVTAVDETGTTTREVILDRGKWLPTEWALGNLLPKDEAGWKTEKVAKEQSTEIRVTRQAASPEQLAWERSRATLILSPTFFAVDYTYEEEFAAGGFEVEAGDPTEAAEGAESQGFLGTLKDKWKQFADEVSSVGRSTGLVPMGKLATRITLTLPGGIQVSNADLIAGSTATWDVTAADLNEGLRIRARSRLIRVGRTAAVGAGGMVLVALTIAAVIAIRRRRGVTW